MSDAEVMTSASRFNRGLHAITELMYDLQQQLGMILKQINDYDVEDDLEEFSQINLKVIRKKKSQRGDTPWVNYIKQCTRHFIETIFSQITNRFPKFIHAVTMDGLMLKVSSFIFSFTLEQSFL